MFHRLSKHLEFRQKYSAARRVFNSLLGFGYPDKTLFLVFDILYEKYTPKAWNPFSDAIIPAKVFLIYIDLFGDQSSFQIVEADQRAYEQTEYF